MCQLYFTGSSQSDSDLSSNSDAEWDGEETAMVVIDHHDYGGADLEQFIAPALASTIVAKHELNYNIGPDYHNGRCGHVLSMELNTEDWDKSSGDRTWEPFLSKGS